ncbi:putative major facilitator superfamily, MFS transporter superfamily [Septoria linicola]|nr:putative major facilitator superfamily, MFS transporter superfamily [Septoria linicola]
MFAPGVPELMREFQTDSSLLATFVVSIYVLGFAFGPLIIAPLSELYGRLWIYHVCNIGFIGFTIACGRAQSMGELCVYRFLQGVWGVCPITIGGGTIADLMPPEKRGSAMAIWAMGPLLGPVIGPVCGGFLSEYVIAMATAVCAVAAFFVMRETYAPTLLEREAAKLRKETGNQDIRSKLDNGLTPKQLFLRAIVRPTKMLFLSPICGLMSLYMSLVLGCSYIFAIQTAIGALFPAVHVLALCSVCILTPLPVYGFLYLLFTTFTYVFEDSYGFSPSTVGLVYIGLGIGNFIAKHGGEIKPEYRLPPLIWAGPLIPVGLFIYGFTAQYQIQWAVPLFGTLLVGVGLIACFMAINTYLVDTFNVYAASALAANTVLRSIFGGVFPLFGLQMYDALGLGWGNALLAFLALAMCPIPWIFYKYGEKIRTHPRWQVQF